MTMCEIMVILIPGALLLTNPLSRVKIADHFILHMWT